MQKLIERLGKAKEEGWHEWIQCEANESAVLAGHRFDLAAAVRVRTFFNQFLRHSKGQWAGQPFTCSTVVDDGPLGAGARLSPRRRVRRALPFLSAVHTSWPLNANSSLSASEFADDVLAIV